MPLYMVNLWEDETAYAERGEANFDAVMKLHQQFSEAVKAAGGRVVTGEALRGIKSATFVADPGKPSATVIDNPLPEIKEQLGGFYILDVPDEQTAVELVKIAPAPYGFAELRPVWDFANEPAAAVH
jgi:hypothetical protein